MSIVGTNDLHGGILPKGDRGGLALFGGYLKNLRAARAHDGGGVLLVDAGDMFQGTLESNLAEGASVVAAYNELGYTAAAVGNHEFDYGPMARRPPLARPPRIRAGRSRHGLRRRGFRFSRRTSSTRAPAQFVAWPNVKPSVVVRVAGVTVGIVGLITREALTATIPPNVGGLAVAPLVETARVQASALRAQGAAVVIVTAHAGGRCARFEEPSDLTSCDASSEVFALARELPRGLVDVIVAGHTHAAIGHQVEGIAITEAFTGGRAFGRVDLTIDRRTHAVTGARSFAPRDFCAREDPATRRCDPGSSSGNLVPAEYENAPVLADPVIERVLAPALERVRALKAQPIGVVLDTPIRRLGPDSPLGHLVTDALVAAAPGAEVSLDNSSGGLRADLPQGPLTYGGLYEVIPFDNVVVRLQLTGRQLRRVFAAWLQKTRQALGFSGVRVRAACAGGSLDVQLIRPSGVPIGDDDPVAIVVSDFLATGGDDILAPVMPPGGFPVDAGAPLVRDVVANYLRGLGEHLRQEQWLDGSSPRLSVSGTLPISCTGS